MQDFSISYSPSGVYKFENRFSLQPNKMVLYTKVTNLQKEELKQHGIIENENRKTPAKTFHNFQISKQARKNLQSKINWLFQLSKSKVVTTNKGKVIYNHKVSFITLTLPSSQAHPTTEITNSCLNQFITEIRDRFKMNNYVWRLEFQKNGNVHYHIVTDIFIEYEKLKNIWIRILSKLGYVQAYTKKMQSYTLNQYWNEYGLNWNKTFPEVAKIYAKSKAEGWARPNCVDVKSCTNDKSISNYISKYFAKSTDENHMPNPLDNEENSFALRLWFCSRSLSKLKAFSGSIVELSSDFIEHLKSYKDVKEIVYDYCKVIYFSLKSLSNESKRFFNEFFRQIGKSTNYIPA